MGFLSISRSWWRHGIPRLPGIIKTKGEGVDHVVSVVGWGTDSKVPRFGARGVEVDFILYCPGKSVPGLVNIYIAMENHHF
jgi:hypothetical protein